MIFKYILLGLLSVFLLYILVLPKQIVLRKTFIVLFVILMMVFAANPNLATVIANYLGIVRGADLLFYLSHTVLFFIAFMYYLKFKDMEIRFAQLVRHIAISDSMHNDNPNADKAP
jgi:hypothetical protein